MSVKEFVPFTPRKVGIMSFEEALAAASRDEGFKATVYAMNTLLIHKGIYTQEEFQALFVEWVEKSRGARRQLLPTLRLLVRCRSSSVRRVFAARLLISAVNSFVTGPTLTLACWRRLGLVGFLPFDCIAFLPIRGRCGKS